MGTARAEKRASRRGLAVEEPIDYTAGAFEKAVGDVDVVMDLVGGDDYGLCSLQTLREGGLMIAIPEGVTDAVAAAAEEQSKRATGLLVEPDAAGLESLAALTADGRLSVVIETTFPLAQAAEAHRRLQRGRARGKIVLTA